MVLAWGDWRPDVSDYLGGTSNLLANVLPQADGYGPFPSPVAFTSPLPAPCRGYFLGLNTDGTVALFAGTETKLYLLNNTDYTWTNVSKTGGTFNYAVPGTDQWQFAQFGDKIVAVNSANPPQVFDLAAPSEFADLGGSPPQAKFVSVINNFLLLSGLSANPFRVQWCANGNITEWTSGVNQAGQQDFPDGGVVQGAAGDDFGGLVFQDNAIRRLVYSPGSPTVFDIDRISEDHGIRAPYSLVRSREWVFFLGDSGFYQIPAAGGQPVPIGKEKWDRTFFRQWDENQPQLMVGVNDPNNTRVFWGYKSINGAEGVFDQLIVYDWALQKATPITGVFGQFLGSVAQPGITLEGLDAPYPNLDEDVPFSLDEFPVAFAKRTSVADPLNRIAFFSGPNLEALLVTRESSGGYQRTYVGGHRPLTDAENVFGSVLSRQSLKDTPVTSQENAIEPIGEIPHRVETRLYRITNRIPEGEDWRFSIGVEPNVSPTGQR